jgi:drug/metabolite transporter (DMT)-like permease
MSPLLTILTALSFIALILLSFYYFLKERKHRLFIIRIIVLILLFIFFNRLFGFPSIPDNLSGRGEANNEVYFVIILYACMLLGMAAHYGYSHFSEPKKERKEFDPGLFFAPIFTSPIIFVPLLAALQNAEIELTKLTAPKMMVFFVAFENGFFWKDYFDQRRKEKARGKEIDPI